MRPEEKVFEVYPPKTKIDIYGECHDEDEELRKAYIKGCHDTVAEIMGDTIKRTELPTSLEEAAEEYALLFDDCTKWKDGGKYKGFIAGAKWQKEQMMKDAAEGDYDCQYMTPAVFLDKYLDGIKDGDKVRIIIVKED